MRTYIKQFQSAPDGKVHGARMIRIGSAIVLGVLAGTASAAASLDQQVTFSIPAQPLDKALLEFSRQADIQMAIDAASLDRIQAPNLTGRLTASVALSRLLQQSGLG